MERGAWIETQFTPWKLARGVSERARARAAQGSCWARAGVERRETDAKVAAITHRECQFGRSPAQLVQSWKRKRFPCRKRKVREILDRKAA
jgi:hypothetical protein